MAATLLYLNTAPCGDCGEPIDYLSQLWYPLEAGGLCQRCGRARGLTGVMPPVNATQGTRSQRRLRSV
jgi:hypothetical protein